ncbi:uncharacterized protein YkwD [Pseudomonas sp. JUb42]|uniref:CAP domain-containing protein n=1 Tax=Pseudomonas sp. JUb42 TaxID=2940611 RepID=UPI002169EF9D|nr:CAP domain-containing protein [Pseudomonas sp. JUb42]MCS3468868.1 uncharacterized protein YkwD [Pseudomonas sp. JUb42]
MRPFLRYASLSLPVFMALFAHPAKADGERQLLQQINAYRAHPDRCDGSYARALAPLTLKSSLALPVDYGGGLRDGLKAAGYQAALVQTIHLVGAHDVESAFDLLQRDYCDSMLDGQYADIGLSRAGSQWRVVLARPQIDPHLGNQQAADKVLLAMVNSARAHPRMCGYQRFAAARPLSWNGALGTAAEGHSRAMAHDNYFAHQGLAGDSPGDRAHAAGYRGRNIGENIAAGQGSPSDAMQGWLASPGHCANLMNPLFTQVGAGYANNARSDKGIYWTMLFGAP